MKILLIDDDESYCELFRKIIGGNATIQTVHTLEDGITTLDKETFDCVVVDLSLPDSDPLYTIDRLRLASPSAVAVALTGNENPAIRAACLKSGADGYIFKGKSDLDAGSILKAVSNAISEKLARTR